MKIRLHIIILSSFLPLPLSYAAPFSKDKLSGCPDLLRVIPYQLNDNGDGASYADGSLVRISKEGVLVGDTLYARTGRGLSDPIFQNLITDEHLRGKIVLDVGTGEGDLVTDLRAVGIDAFGTDIFLDRKQLNTGHFFAADTAKLPFADNSFDVAISSHSTFYYSWDASEMQSQLNELSRVVKSGGLILIYGGASRRFFPLALNQSPNVELIDTTDPMRVIKLKVIK